MYCLLILSCPLGHCGVVCAIDTTEANCKAAQSNRHVSDTRLVCGYCQCTRSVSWVVCGEGRGDWKALCLLFNKLGLCIGFLWSQPLLYLCWTALEVRAPLNLGLMACHRFKRTQVTACLASCLLEISISKYAPACINQQTTAEPGIWTPDPCGLTAMQAVHTAV